MGKSLALRLLESANIQSISWIKAKSVTTKTLSRICDALPCKIEDICGAESSDQGDSMELEEQA